MVISANFFGSFFLKTGRNLCPVPLFRVHSKYWCLQGQPLVPTTQAQVPAFLSTKYDSSDLQLGTGVVTKINETVLHFSEFVVCRFIKS